MKKNNRLYIMMACAALFIIVGYFVVNAPPPPPPLPPNSEGTALIESHIDALSKQLYNEDSCKEIRANVEDAALDNETKSRLGEQLERAILLSLIKTYNHYQSIDCGNLSNRKDYYNKLLAQFERYPGNKSEVNRCKADYTNISAFKNIQNRIIAMKNKRYDDVAISTIKNDINTLHSRIGGCLSQEKASYFAQLSDFANKEKQYQDYSANPYNYNRLNKCATFAGYSYYLAQFNCP